MAFYNKVTQHNLSNLYEVFMQHNFLGGEIMFSRRTIVEAVSLLGGKTNAEIYNFGLKFDLEQEARGNSKQERINGITKRLIDLNQSNPSIVDQIIMEILEERLKDFRTINERYEYWEENITFENKYPKLLSCLKQDGFSIVNNSIQRQLPESISLSDNQNEVFSLLDKHGFITLRTHLEQAIDAHANGKWESANAQLRAYAEGLFDEMADTIFGIEIIELSSNAKRVKLSETNPPLFNPDYNEMDSTGKNFINGIFKRLHPAGPHAGLSDSDDSTFRLHLVLLLSSYYLRKFDKGVQA